MRSDAACTQVRGGTARPSVADWQHAKVCVQPAVVASWIQLPAVHAYHLASEAACTQTPSGRSFAIVAELHVPPPPPPLPVAPAKARSSASEPLKRSRSIPPLIPGTLPLSLYCQNAQVSHGDV